MGCCVYVSYEPITPPGDSFDIPRLIGRVSKSVPQPLYGGVDTVVKFNDRVVRPQTFLDVLPGDYFTRRFEEHSQDLERLLLESNPVPVFAQFSPSNIEHKRAKPYV